MNEKMKAYLGIKSPAAPAPAPEPVPEPVQEVAIVAPEPTPEPVAEEKPAPKKRKSK